MKKKLMYLIFIIPVFSVLLFFHHEQSIAIEKKNNIDIINSRVSITYKSFSNYLLNIHMNLVKMENFFQSDPNMIPDIYNDYYFILKETRDMIVNLETEGLKLQNLCNNLDSYSNKICFVYADDMLSVKDNYLMVVKKFNDVILKYNDMSLSDYEIFW